MSEIEPTLKMDKAYQIASRVATTAAAATTTTTSSSSSSLLRGVKLVYTTHSSWPYLPTTNTNQPSTKGYHDIAVLDSSFNPPSRAHMALMLSRPILSTPTGKSNYDAHLLLFSTVNADKGTGKPGDASLSQRIQMMTLLALDLERQLPSCNVAVGLVDQPLIFSKSTLTWSTLLASQSWAETPTTNGDHFNRPPPRLHWLVGFDTLYRVFQLKYYPSAQELHRRSVQFFEKEKTTFVCARRDPSSFPTLFEADQEKDAEQNLLYSETVKPWVDAQSIAMLDLSHDEASLSSTEIRKRNRDPHPSFEQKKKQLDQMVPPLLVEYLLESRVYTNTTK